MRRFLVDGRPTFCLAEKELPRFRQTVRELYNARIAERVCGFGR
ncbi:MULTISPECIES: hypothetical protein [unclassified Methylobacterium]|nr:MULTISPECIES: hypothetical protein [unclassified Methylobacterium]